MFINERGNDLYLGQAIPRYWLTDKKTVSIKHAPSLFGPLSLTIESHAAAGNIKAIIDPPQRNQPKTIYLRIRHPQARPIRSITVNDQPYSLFDVEKEWVILSGKIQGRQEIIVNY